MKKSLLVALVLSSAFNLSASVKLHPLFADGVVLQQGQPVPVWGTADPGAEVKVSFAGQSVSALANEAGDWRLDLAPLPASMEPGEVSVSSGADTQIVRNVLVGEVWIASGQSNMDSPMRSGRTAELLSAAADSAIRFFVVKKNVAPEPLFEPQGKWIQASPETARDFSGVAFLFAQSLRASENVPVGIIQAAWGGTSIKTWMSAASIEEAPPAERILAELREARAKQELSGDDRDGLAAYYSARMDWEESVDKPFRAARKEWQAAADAAKAAGQPISPQPQLERPKPETPAPLSMPAPGTSDRPAAPTGCFNAMIAPLSPFAIKGVLWYQGEADASRGLEYRDLLQRLIRGWRTYWALENLPFLIVQLPGHGKNEESVSTKGIAWLREAQDMAQALRHVHTAITSDIGDVADVHPDNKPETAERLARLAGQVIYGQKIAGVSPRHRSMEIEGNRVVLTFDHAEGGLRIGQTPWVSKNGKEFPLDRVAGFYIAGSDKKWVEADAEIRGDSVVVSSASVPEPVAVRYAWANTPVANLYSEEGLPVAPFRTDDWPQ